MKTLAVLLEYTDKGYDLYAAVEVAEKKFVVMFGHITQISNYNVNLAIAGGRILPKENANALFEKITFTHDYDKSYVPVTVADVPPQFKSLGALYEEAQGLVDSSTADNYQSVNEQLLKVLKQIQSLERDSILRPVK